MTQDPEVVYLKLSRVKSGIVYGSITLNLRNLRNRKEFKSIMHH